MQRHELYYIDKTECLEKGIVVFPSIYIMGAAATGKSTAVKMFLEKNPQAASMTIDMEKVSGEKVMEQIDSLVEHMKENPFYLVLENVPAKSDIYQQLADFIVDMPEKGRVILVGRHRLPEEMLPLLWKRKMEIVPQESLAFTKEDIRLLAKYWESDLNANLLWEQTGGWTGCVDLMLRMSMESKRTEEELRKSYEIDTYIEKFIVHSLKDEERQLFMFAMSCPWINGEMCENILQISQAEQHLKMLTRQGFLTYNGKLEHFKAAPLFAGCKLQETCDLQCIGQWYEEREFLREALQCYEQTGDITIYETFVSKYYNLIPFNYRFFMKGNWSGNSMENYYLQGMKYYMSRDFAGLDRKIQELQQLETSDEFLKKEILLNLYYTKPDFTLNDWLEMLENATKEFENTGKTFRLYNVLGNSCTYLCGIRDLTGLFACPKKEENHKAKIWKNAFGEREWTRYQLAKIDYYLETERRDSIRDEEMEVLQSADVNPLAKIYLLGKLHRISKDNDYAEQFRHASEEVLRIEDVAEARIAEGYISIHSPWINEPERLTRWLRQAETIAKSEINEQNYCELWFMAKGYLLLGQYKKAEKILQRLIPYIKAYNRQKFLAEALFQQAIISWENGSHSQSLQNVIESFYTVGNARYVRFYVSYGKRGKEVLEAYADWHQQTEPESWSRKKKYQYGNVLRMPVAEYLDVIMRGVRREARSGQLFQTQPEDVINEHLTMMETIILQDIGRGLTNQEICIEQNLKMPTVKSHIYSLYKKLGVNSRVQATIKGKEMGILE